MNRPGGSQNRLRIGSRDRAAGLRAAVLVLSVVGGCDRGRVPQPGEPPGGQFPVEHLGAFYQAGGYLEMDQYLAAAEHYERLLTAVPDPAVQANLAASLIGLQRFDEALIHARQAWQAAPDNADVGLVCAAALQATAAHAEALTLLRALAKNHPQDARVRYGLIAALRSTAGTTPEDLAGQFAALLTVVPRNLVALLEASAIEARRGNLQEASRYRLRLAALLVDPPVDVDEPLQTWAAAEATGDAAAVARQVTIVGNLLRGSQRFRADILQLAVGSDNVPAAVAHPLRPLGPDATSAAAAEVRLEEATAALGLAAIAGDPRVRGIAVGTVRPDRSPALYVLREGSPGSLLVRDGGRFVDVTEQSGLGTAAPASAVTFMDADNDRHMDLLLITARGLRAYLNDGNGRFGDGGGSRGVPDGPGLRGAEPFDFDQDGDLDLLVWDDAGLRAFQNDGEGWFGRGRTCPGLPEGLSNITRIQPIDLDDDGDIDLVVTRGSDPWGVAVFSNERLGVFRAIDGPWSTLRLQTPSDPLIVDHDNDGWLELLDSVHGTGFEIGADFQPRESVGAAASEKKVRGVAAADFDCDGRTDLLRLYADGSLDSSGPRLDPSAGIQAVDLDGDGRVDLLSGRGQACLNRSHGAGNWLAVSLSALITGDTRFNAFGIGSTIEVRAGALYQKRHVRSATTHFGLGPHRHADLLRVVWPNGSYQNLEYRASDRMNLAANQVVVEEQSLKGSCPYLYAWNGTRFEFVTDVLWRSALGMSIMQGIYGHHGTSDDYFRITAEQWVPRDGFYELQFTEELWETAYFDYCRLVVVDHPQDTWIFADEKCQPPPYPGLQLFAVRQARTLPARDQDDRDLTEVLAHRDRRYVGGFRPTRYQGLVEAHDLILDLGEFAADDPVHLFLQGWLWPTDASVNVAVDQNPRLQAVLPRVSVADGRGGWIDGHLPVGFPSGKDKTIVLDLTGRLPTTDHRVKLSTNFAIFWDRAFATVGPQDVPVRQTLLPVASADLHERGFSHEYVRVPGGPMIPDYQALDHQRQWRDLVGWYTRFGEVTDLLQQPDSQYVIVGPGDEITLRFDATALPPLADGWRRDFVIHTDGWLKDGDLNSATGKTVEPLPFHGMSDYPYPADEHYPDAPAYRRYRASYLTRLRTQDSFRDRLRQPRRALAGP